ncbi:hypothetical protein [Leucobacter sp. W1153]|uniref:hypothetical protein n=1 Tax=unclassified Leucobacter TaxID=2621730 RepID=UPI003F2CFD03
MGSRHWANLGRAAAIVGTVVLAVAVIWVDIATSLWQEVVVLSGFVGALLSFLFTILILNRVVARQTARRWAPMIRLALTEFLHSLADTHRSEETRGMIVPRYLPEIPTGEDAAATDIALARLRGHILKERKSLARSLSAWAEILTSSGANEQILFLVADVVVQLDVVRRLSVELEHSPNSSLREDLTREIKRCNQLFDEIVAAIVEQLTATATTHAHEHAYRS